MAPDRTSSPTYDTATAIALTTATAIKSIRDRFEESVRSKASAGIERIAVAAL